VLASFVAVKLIEQALWGPLSFLTAYLILTDSPYRHPVQSLVSLGQAYGDVLYYATNTFDIYYRGLSYSRPEFIYFWFYYVIINSFWIVIPSREYKKLSKSGTDQRQQSAFILA
jgi:cholestenol Delta-isomerase